MVKKISRRELLGRSAALSAVGTTSTLAGCADLPLLGGGDTSLRSTFHSWLPIPGAIPTDDPLERYGFVGADVAGLRSAPAGVDQRIISPPAFTFKRLGLSPDAVDFAVNIRGIQVYAGNFDTDSPTESDLKHVGSDGSFRVYEGELPPVSGGTYYDDPTHRVAVSDSHTVEVPLEFYPPEALKTVLDIKTDETSQYVATDDDVETLVDVTSGLLKIDITPRERVSESAATPQQGTFAGAVGTARGYDISDDVLRTHYFCVFDTPSTAEATDVDRFVNTMENAPDHEYGAFRHGETAVDGRVLQIVFETPLDELATTTTT